MTRQDIHRTSQIIPTNYEFVFAYSRAGADDPGYNSGLLRATYTGDDAWQERVPQGFGFWGRETRRNWLGKLEYAFGHPNHQCDICGAHHRHGSVFRHEPTGDHIQVGHVCADKLDMAKAPKEFYDAKKRSAQIRKARREARNRFSALRVWAEDHPEELELLGLDHYIAHDMRSRLISNPQGGLTDKQVELLRKLSREANEPKEDELPSVPVPIIDGRVTIEGEILATKLQETDFGSSLKMLLQVRQNGGAYRLWGTVPQYIAEWPARPLKGSRVRFDARIKRSDKDEAFGFFSRPTKPEVLEVTVALM